MKKKLGGVLILSILMVASVAVPLPAQSQGTPEPQLVTPMVTGQPPTWISLYWKANQKPGVGHFPYVFEIAGAETGDPGYGVGIYAGARSGASGSHMYAINAVVERRAGHPRGVGFGVEVNTNNSAEHDGRDQWPSMVAFAAVQGGMKSPRAAFLIGSSSGVPYRNGIDMFEGSVSDFVFRYGNRFQVHTNGTVWVDRGEGRGQEQLVPKSWLDALEARVAVLEAH